MNRRNWAVQRVSDGKTVFPNVDEQTALALVKAQNPFLDRRIQLVAIRTDMIVQEQE